MKITKAIVITVSIRTGEHLV